MWSFIKQFFLHPKEVGSIIPSSHQLVNEMLKPIDFEKAQHIVELGPGDGVITKEILKRMKTSTKLTVIEINKEFCKALQNIGDPKLHLINDSALNLTKHIKTADYIISGLPLANFSDKDTITIIDQIKKIKKHKYIQYHYSPIREADYKKHFKHLTKKIVIKNIPPAIVYTMR